MLGDGQFRYDAPRTSWKGRSPPDDLTSFVSESSSANMLSSLQATRVVWDVIERRLQLTGVGKS